MPTAVRPELRRPSLSFPPHFRGEGTDVTAQPRRTCRTVSGRRATTNTRRNREFLTQLHRQLVPPSAARLTIHRMVLRPFLGVILPRRPPLASADCVGVVPHSGKTIRVNKVERRSALREVVPNRWAVRCDRAHYIIVSRAMTRHAWQKCAQRRKLSYRVWRLGFQRSRVPNWRQQCERPEFLSASAA